MDSRNLTRRDWFRLRTQPVEPRCENEPAARPRAMGESLLAPIELPVNHDGMELSQLPPMREALLNASQIEALFADIANLATNVLLMQRMDGAQRASAAAVSASDQLMAAQQALRAGKVQRVQVRYSWDNSAWIDTLERKTNEFRLVRIAHKVGSSGSS
jgi:hypothetical protein